ncbi:acetyl-CoA carboxylase [Pseudonocardia hispaniensis]|uniref:Biotin carboxyl carrier protein of acetyl-CoA carboxylase n=1 Tax=Pseudonocardia hispaniensis TaxID=904933 RepID=A0ABW1J4N6_9PSEU
MARHEVISPIPGVFYRRPDPDSDPFATEGQLVAAADVVCLVEVMKSFHQVAAGAAGTVVEFLVENEDVVEAGQPVAVIEPTGIEAG